MAWREVNPAELEGEELRRWYLRSPEEIERQRQATAEVEYRAFFGGLRPAGTLSFCTAPQSSRQVLGTPVGANVRSSGNDVVPAFN